MSGFGGTGVGEVRGSQGINEGISVLCCNTEPEP